ncbi:bile acid:sodium symporter family protein [Novosphingobium album (ex Hu et al. 2023)]|uniref:Bile acid:sodium symporter family protein n=1 Tax=Novosphingobium album (ex Hu et al. 2023) TaxID=2930093 RepID=A0ABT0AYQ3_9SPHN|nr:bile acid:sodium symporter family protein [Novosphingobium album (ex Hu et al. 2023)]MCJ2177937.1 bile acid:sodium symporter family protein [Novosphingobium album (ex Hu et al. 2023)]
MTRLFDRITGLFALWTVLGVGLAWFSPDVFLWLADGRFKPFGQPLISVMLGVIMLGMGITLSFDDFRRVLALPRQVMAGVVLQFTVMPLAGFTSAWLFGLEPGLAVGLILVSCCPGGTASNVISYLARANVALSVTMTMASTLIAIAMTPVLTGWLAGVFIEIDRWNLFREMLAVVLVPVIAGVLMNRYLPKFTQKVTVVSPFVSVLFVVLIVSGIIARSKPLIELHAGVLLLAVFSLHACGFGLGYMLSRLLRLKESSARTISVEVGMQNSGLGASLASSPAFARQFSSPMQAALAPVPAAISAVMHVLIGSLLASIWSRSVPRDEQA